MPRRMPREGRRGCSGTCPAHLGKDPRRSLPPRCFFHPPGSWGGGRGCRAGTRRAGGARARPLRCSLLGRMLGGGGSGEPPCPPPSTSPSMGGGGSVVRVPPPPQNPDILVPGGFFPRHKAQLLSPEEAASALQPVPNHPPLPRATPTLPGGLFPSLGAPVPPPGWRHSQTFPAPDEVAAGRGWRQSPFPREDRTPPQKNRLTDGQGGQRGHSRRGTPCWEGGDPRGSSSRKVPGSWAAEIPAAESAL